MLSSPYVEFTGRDSIFVSRVRTGYIPGESLVITVEDDSSRRVPGCPHDSPSPRLTFSFQQCHGHRPCPEQEASSAGLINLAGSTASLVSQYLKVLLLFTFAPLFVVFWVGTRGLLYILQFDLRLFIADTQGLAWLCGEEEQTPSWKLLFKEADSESLTT